MISNPTFPALVWKKIQLAFGNPKYDFGTTEYALGTCKKRWQIPKVYFSQEGRKIKGVPPF